MSQCWEETGKNPIKTELVDTNKGTSECSNLRFRSVAKEYNTGPRPHLFSATSPLEGVDLVISEAASSNTMVTVLQVIDVRRVHFHSQATRRVYVELPEEDGAGLGSQYHSERLRGVLELISRFEFDFRRRGNCFLNDSNFWCV